ncbi:MAG: sigma-54-dependent transcriptional regulator [Thermoguttaceae bacterium]
MKILFADDEATIREVLSEELALMGHSVISCAGGTEAIAALKKGSFDLLLLDLDMPGATGLQVIEQVKELGSDADTVILTGKGTVETAIEAIHHGVSDYLIKPYKISDLERIIVRIGEKRELMRRCLAMMNQIQRIEGERKLIGNSEPMQRVYRLIDKIAPTESTVVILGETGTGKELVARAIHDQSSRQKKPFVAVNCGALPENLIESELFGHRKGSFTGADSNRVGLLEVANGGTLFLDEIGELPKGVQAKMLRFLESGEVRRIGENTATICDVRVVCATLRNLELMVQCGDFREDLWFRINTFEIHIPTLKERLEDLPDLIMCLAARFHRGIEKLTMQEMFTEKAYQCLCGYDWPGNVRQLANTIEHALILADRFPIDVDSLPLALQTSVGVAHSSSKPEHIGERILEQKPSRPVVHKSAQERPVLLSNSDELLNSESSRAGDKTELVSPRESSSVQEPSLETLSRGGKAFNKLMSFDPIEELPNAGTTLRSLEMQAISAALERNEGNKAKAAEELGISLKTLYNKLNQADLRRTA